MKLPEETNRFCPYCKTHTVQKVSVAKQKSRSATHPNSRGGKFRLKARGLTSGPGNHGKYSMPPPKKRKRKSKQTKRLSVLYTCKVCKKSKGIKKAIRTSRINIGDKVAK
jgi:large subunit ribosomal protein L44e